MNSVRALANERMQQRARQELLEQITDRMSGAIQADIEHGVRALNNTAAEKFQREYPAIYSFHKWLHDLYVDGIEGDDA